MSRHTRLDRIERDLSPDERVFVWLADAHAFGSHDAYVDWLLDRPEDEHPGRIADELLTRGRRGRRGRAGPDRTAMAAAQRADLLVLLAIELDGRVRVELQALDARIEVLAWRWSWVRNHDNAAGASGDPDAIGSSSDHLAAWARDVTDCSIDLMVIERVAATLSDRFFAGRPVLWPDRAEGLTRLGDLVASLVGLAEACCPDARSTFEARERVVDVVAADEVRSIATLVRAKVLDRSGSPDEADRRIRAHLRRDRDRRAALQRGAASADP